MVKAINSVFESFGTWYDDIYQDKDYGAEANKIFDFLSRFSGDGKDLLEFGMGTGKHASELVKKGYTVHGIELSHEMLSQVQTSSKLTVNHGDITEYNAYRTFDAVVCMFHVLGYITETHALDRLFQNAARHLDINGVFIFDYWYAPAVLSQGVDVRVKRMPIKDGLLIRLAEPTKQPNRNVVSVKYTLFQCDREGRPVERFEETHEMRYFSVPEINTFCERHGFVIERHECFDTGDDLSEKSWNAISVARKL